MMYVPLLYLHILAGSLSLVLFWIPILTKKGRLNHKRIGKLYVISMSVVVGSAFVLSLMQIIAGSLVEGLALLFLSMITLIPLVSGVQVLRAKRPSPGYRRLRLVLAAALLLVSTALLIAYWQLGSIILLVFALLGLLGGGGDIRRFVRTEGSGKTWLREHYEAMLFSGAAAYTAFFAFGGRALLSDVLTGWWGILPWILPTLLTIALLPLVHRQFHQAK